MTSWYAVIDAAQDERLHPLIQQCAAHECLLSGTIAPVLAAAAPWLVRIDDREPLIGIWQQHGAGQNWGILIESDLPLGALRKHLRRFLQVILPDGMVVQFRFYDPRVFATYLSGAPAEQVAQWFEGVKQVAAEGEGGVQHSFRWRGGQLYDGDRPLAAAQG